MDVHECKKGSTFKDFQDVRRKLELLIRNKDMNTKDYVK